MKQPVKHLWWNFLWKYLNLSDPCILESCTKIKTESNFHLHTSLWWLKRFHKTFWGTTKKWKIKILSSFFLFVRDRDGEGNGFSQENCIILFLTGSQIRLKTKKIAIYCWWNSDHLIVCFVSFLQIGNYFEITAPKNQV